MLKKQWTPNAIFDHLRKVISTERFLKKQGLGNEVPFFICPYNPSYHVDIERRRKQLINLLKNNEHTGVTIVEINLYDLAVELLKERGIWERVLQEEPHIGKGELKDLLTNVLDPEQHLIPAIEKKIAPEQVPNFDVLFLSGVGEIYPYLRSHTILNNLQSAAKDKPTVLFFPGEYTQTLKSGASLDLFGRLRDDKYYRAFNILSYEV